MATSTPAGEGGLDFWREGLDVHPRGRGGAFWRTPRVTTVPPVAPHTHGSGGPLDHGQRSPASHGDACSRWAAAPSASPPPGRCCRPRCRRRWPPGPPAGGLSAVKHVVILMQENRSFDHYFGTLRGVRGFGDRNAVQLPSGRPVFEQPGAARQHRPALPRARRGRRAAEGPPVHRRPRPLLERRRQGLERRLDGQLGLRQDLGDHGVLRPPGHPAALRARRHLHRLRRLPLLHPQFHQPQPQPSVEREDRLRGRTVSGPSATTPTTRAPIPGTAGAPTPSGSKRPGAAGRRTPSGRTSPTTRSSSSPPSRRSPARRSPRPVGTPSWSPSTPLYATPLTTPSAQRLLGLLDQGVATLTKAERSLFERGLRRVPTGTLADAFGKDVAAGTLPEVSYLVPSALDSEHPSVSSPVHSATIVYKVLDALGKHPDVWRHTVVLINYDENDGFFDHVPPPVAPPEVADEQWEGKPTGLGARVPLLVVSPWSVGGYVCSEVFDHTSVIRFLETVDRGARAQHQHVAAHRHRRPDLRLRLQARQAAARRDPPGPHPAAERTLAPRAARPAAHARTGRGHPARPAAAVPAGRLRTRRRRRPPGAAQQQRPGQRPLRALSVRQGIRRSRSTRT